MEINQRTIAFTAREFIASSEPPLKPNHPNHSNAVPSIVFERLCGVKLGFLLFPIIRQQAKPEKPETM